MTDKIYVVMGTSGWDEDRTEWPVIAHLDLQAAQEHAAKARARAKEIHLLWLQVEGGEWVHVLSAKNEYDPYMESTGNADYYVFGVDIADSYTGTNQPNEGTTLRIDGE